VISKGFEVETTLRITHTLNLDAGYTYADTHYADQLTGRDGRALPAPLFMLPGQNLSNDPKNVITAGATWTPTVIPAKDIRALVHADVRYQSSSNTGSDLALEKVQPAYALINARIGLLGKDDGWSLEFWCQNVFNQEYTQIVGTAPFQPPGGGTIGALLAGQPGVTVANSLFINFLGEPRTFGATARTKF
jgi:outer membrane receptor for ferric coprogen and ferric-rhodotorulic acid